MFWHKKPTEEAELAATAFNLATGWDAATARGQCVVITVGPGLCDTLTRAYTDSTTIT